MNNTQAREYIDSIMNNYDSYIIQVSNTDPSYRQCSIWLSQRDLEALEMGKSALKKLDDIFKIVNGSKGFEQQKIMTIRSLLRE